MAKYRGYILEPGDWLRANELVLCKVIEVGKDKRLVIDILAQEYNEAGVLSGEWELIRVPNVTPYPNTFKLTEPTEEETIQWTEATIQR